MNDRWFRILIESAREGVCWITPDGMIAYANPCLAAMFGYGTNEVIGTSLFDYLGAEQHALVLRKLIERAQGMAERYELMLRRRDGTPLWISIAAGPLLDDDGRFAGALIMISDLSEQKRAEQVRTHEQRLLRQIAGNTPLHEVLDDLCRTLEALAQRPLRCAIQLADLQGRRLTCIAAPNLPAAFREDRVSTLLEDSRTACAQAVRTGLPVIVPDMEQPGISSEMAEIRNKFGFGAIWSYPLIQDGETLGTLVLLPLAAGTPDDGEERLIEFALQIARLAIAHHRNMMALSESEQRFRDFADMAADWFWEQDVQFRFTKMFGGGVNKGGARLADFLGRARWELPIEDITEAQWVEHRARLERHEDFRDFVYSIRVADNTLRWYAISGKPVFAPDGAFLGYRGTGRDITMQRQALEEVRASETLLNKVLELLPVGVWFMDANGHIRRTNAAGARIWGGARYLGLDLAGEYKGWWVKTGKRIEPEEWAGARAIMKGETSIEEEIEIEGFDGTRKIILNSAMPLRREDGTIQGAIFVNQDITARWQAERQVRKMNATLEERVRTRTAQLEAVNHELDAFNFSVSHDLRTPLRSIDGFSQALLEDHDARLDDEGREHLRRIRAAAQRMAGLIDALFSLSSLSRASLQICRIDLSAEASSVIEEFRQAEPGRRAEAIIAEGVIAEGDARLIRNVLSNLLANAWKYTGRTAQPRIEFGVIAGETKAAVYFVRDNGAGFDMQFADKLFKPFHRLHREEEFGGLGVGLATVQRIVRRHGGRVWGEAEKGKGATFFFTLWENGSFPRTTQEVSAQAWPDGQI